MNVLFVEAVKERIHHFNETRGRRKELNPNIVDHLPLPNKKFGRIIRWEGSPISDIEHRLIPRMAEVTVRTMLRLRPRPHTIDVAVFENVSSGDYLFRLKIPLN